MTKKFEDDELDSMGDDNPRSEVSKNNFKKLPRTDEEEEAELVAPKKVSRPAPVPEQEEDNDSEQPGVGIDKEELGDIIEGKLARLVQLFNMYRQTR